jgi:2,4-didehydro-3-deoxy-L-rhamnonate hydrolase
MRLASFHARGRDRIGLAIAEGVLVDAAEVLGTLPDTPPAADLADMMAVVRAGAPMLEALRRALQAAQAAPARFSTYASGEVTWHPPVRTPSKIVCIALNNRALDAVKIKAPTDHPAFFLKPFTALTGHLQPIELRRAFGLTHPEPELGVVIGTRLRHASPAEAIAGVYGYTIVNDVTCVGMREEDSFTVRTFRPGADGSISVGEAHTSYPGRYKASDTFAPMGPFLVTREEVPDPAALTITCHLGDRLVASDHTKNYVWSVADALSHVSRTMTLLPGDIVSMGTAVGGAPDPDAPQVPGVTRANLIGLAGLVTISISGLGTLENPVQTT